MSKEPQLYKFKDIEHRLHTLEPGKSYIKPFVTSKVSNTMWRIKLFKQSICTLGFNL